MTGYQQRYIRIDLHPNPLDYLGPTQACPQPPHEPYPHQSPLNTNQKLTKYHTCFTDPPFPSSQQRDTLYYFVNKTETFSIPLIFPVCLFQSFTFTGHKQILPWPGAICETSLPPSFPIKKLLIVQQKGEQSKENNQQVTQHWYPLHRGTQTRELAQFVVYNEQTTLPIRALEFGAG